MARSANPAATSKSVLVTNHGSPNNPSHVNGVGPVATPLVTSNVAGAVTVTTVPSANVTSTTPSITE